MAIGWGRIPQGSPPALVAGAYGVELVAVDRAGNQHQPGRNQLVALPPFRMGWPGGQSGARKMSTRHLSITAKPVFWPQLRGLVTAKPAYRP